MTFIITVVLKEGRQKKLIGNDLIASRQFSFFYIYYLLFFIYRFAAPICNYHPINFLLLSFSEYANPIESEVKSNVGSINSINQHDTFRPNLESTFVSTTGPIGTLLNRATSLEPYSGYPSSSSSSSTEQSSLSSSSSSSSNKGNDFFTNHKLSKYIPISFSSI